MIIDNTTAFIKTTILRKFLSSSFVTSFCRRHLSVPSMRLKKASTFHAKTSREFSDLLAAFLTAIDDLVILVLKNYLGKIIISRVCYHTDNYTV